MFRYSSEYSKMLGAIDMPIYDRPIEVWETIESQKFRFYKNYNFLAIITNIYIESYKRKPFSLFKTRTLSEYVGSEYQTTNKEKIDDITAFMSWAKIPCNDILVPLHTRYNQDFLIQLRLFICNENQFNDKMDDLRLLVAREEACFYYNNLPPLFKRIMSKKQHFPFVNDLRLSKHNNMTVMKTGVSYYYDGDIRSFESLNMESINNFDQMMSLGYAIYEESLGSKKFKEIREDGRFLIKIINKEGKIDRVKFSVHDTGIKHKIEAKKSRKTWG